MPPTLCVHVAGETEDDDPDVVMSRLEVPSLASYQWRSMCTGKPPPSCTKHRHHSCASTTRAARICFVLNGALSEKSAIY